MTDAEAREKLVDEAVRLIEDPAKRADMSAEIKKMAIYDSDMRIADEVCNLLNIKNER